MGRMAHGAQAVTTLAMWGLAACAQPDTGPGAPGLEVVSAPTTGTPGQLLDDWLVARVVDEFGHARTGIRVDWNTADGGSLSPASTISGPDGLVAVQWRLGNVAGTQTANALVTGQEATRIRVEARAFQADRIDAGFGFACGLRGTDLWCWGTNSAVVPEGSTTPRRIMPGVAASDLAVSDEMVCVLDADGAAWCLGNAYGNPDPPVLRVPDVPPLTSVTAGDSRFCGIAVDHTAWCWRRISGTAMEASQVSATLAFRTISTGGGAPSGCGITLAGETWCWGNDVLGQRGDGPVDNTNAAPTLVAGSHRFREVAAGGTFACALDDQLLIWCWGQSFTEGTGSDVPTRLAAASAATISAGWSGLLGNGPGQTTLWSLNGPVSIQAHEFAGFNFTQVSMDDSYCLLSVMRDVYCDLAPDYYYSAALQAVPAEGD